MTWPGWGDILPRCDAARDKRGPGVSAWGSRGGRLALRRIGAAGVASGT